MRTALALLLTCLPLWAQMPRAVVDDLLSVAAMPTPSAPAGPGLAPTNDVAGCIFWITSDSLSLNQDDPITAVTDSSGNGNDATGATDQEPTYNENQLDSHASMAFSSAVPQYFIANGLADDLSGTDTTFTAFFIIKLTDVNNFGHFFYAFSSTNSNPYRYLRNHTSADRLYYGSRGDASDCLVGNYWNGRAWAMTNWCLISATFTAGAWNIRTNAITACGESGGGTGCAATLNSFYIGALNSTTYGINGDIVDFSLFSPSLSDADRHYVETNYYLAKYPSVPIVP